MNDKYNFAMYVPEIKHSEWEVKEGKVTLYFKVNDPVKKFASWLVKKSPSCDVELDDMCSQAWLSIDGEKSIYDISKIMAKMYNEEINVSIYRLVTYMRYISKRGWIAFKEVKQQ